MGRRKQFKVKSRKSIDGFEVGDVVRIKGYAPNQRWIIRRIHRSRVDVEMLGVKGRAPVSRVHPWRLEKVRIESEALPYIF